MQTAKVAAVGAAVGAAMGAASALAGRGDRDDDEENRAPSALQEPDEAEDDDEPRAREPDETIERDDRRGAGNSQVSEQRQRENEYPSFEEEIRRPERERSDGEPQAASPDQARKLVERAREQLQALRGVDAESVSSLAHGYDGWTVTLEVVEVSRIPPSTDVLASYEVVLDDDGKLVRYGRTRRYYRAQADDGGRT
jgi:hypothetical protein